MQDDKRSFGFATALLVAAAMCELSSAVLVLCNAAPLALGAHALASIGAGLASSAILRDRHGTRHVVIASSCIGAFVASAPLLGMTVLATVIAPAWRRQSASRNEAWVELPMHGRAQVGAASLALRAQIARPAADARAREQALEQTVVPIREVLEGSSPKERIQAVMALRRMPARDALPLLRTALGDASEDVRLLSYAILERREKTLRASIERKLEALDEDGVQQGGASQLAALRELAHDHWELVHGGFVEGELAQRTLQLAAEHARAALELIGRETGAPEGLLSVLLARIELRRGETAGAARALEIAADAGVADSTLAPLLAELAFIERRFDRIPGLLASAAGAQLDRPRLSAVIEHWRGPESRHG